MPCFFGGIAETTGVVKNRMDLFDPYFENNRKGWWQKSKGRVRLTAKEFEKTKEFQSDFILSLVTNLDDIPKLVLIDNPMNHFEFKKSIIKNEVIEYRSLEYLY